MKRRRQIGIIVILVLLLFTLVPILVVAGFELNQFFIFLQSVVGNVGKSVFGGSIY